ncbi:MAG: hypothetical protein MJA82_15200 [Clostridia bacterium]|nr:hypothetical protein [Clostridia bacterium]
MTTTNNERYLDVITYAVSAGITSTAEVGQRLSVGLANVLSAAAEELGQDLSYRVLLGNPLHVEYLIIETVVDGVVVPVDFTNGFAQVDGVVANTTLPTFITFNKEGTYIFTIELIEPNSTNVLAKDIEIAQVVGLF